MFYYTTMTSPVGKLYLVASDRALVQINWTKPKRIKMTRKLGHPVLRAAEKQLNQYFLGTRKKFDLPIDFTGTDFQKSAWKALRKIPFGKTRSYSDQAKMLGDVKKVRAVGSANGKNPISIVVPCHRVIAKDGSLAGFAGGLKKKKWLLEHEKTLARLR